MDDALKVWLGPAYDEMNEGQRAEFGQSAAFINRTYLHPDEEGLRQVALNLAVQRILGEDEGA